MPRIAEVFTDNGQQAVRLPADMHLSADVVSIRQDETTGDIILSPQHSANNETAWAEFFRLRDELTPEELAGFEIPRDRSVPKSRDIIG